MIRISSILFLVSCLLVAVYVYYSSALYTAQKPEKVVENLVRSQDKQERMLVTESELRVGFPQGVMARIRDSYKNEAGIWDKKTFNAIPQSEVVQDTLKDSLLWISVQAVEDVYTLELTGAHESAVVVMLGDQPSSLIQIDSHDPSAIYAYSLSIGPDTKTLKVEQATETP